MTFNALYSINILGMIVDLFLILLCFINQNLSKGKRIGFILSAILLFIVSLSACLQFYILDNQIYQYRLLLTFLKGICFSIMPVIPLILIINTKKINKWLSLIYSIPLIINLLCNFIN